MKTKAHRLILLALSMILVVAGATSVSAAQKWKSIRSGQIRLAGDVSEKKLSHLYQKIRHLRIIFNDVLEPEEKPYRVPTYIIIFNSEKEFRKFKQFSVGGRKDWVAGFFQPGEDVNFIALSDKGKTADTVRTIFHEYTHSLVNIYFGPEMAPPWINEGLSEYFEHTQITKRREARLGLPRIAHGQVIDLGDLMPLDEFFRIDYRYLDRQPEKGVERFYFQAWLLIHFLLNSDGDPAVSEKNKQFLRLALTGEEPGRAYQKIFSEGIETLEEKLKQYLIRGIFPIKKRIIEEDEKSVKPPPRPLSAAEIGTFKAYLLYSMRSYDAAEINLREVLANDPRLAEAKLILGLLKMDLGEFAEARKWLEEAVSGDPDNFLIHYRYAYLLSREEAELIGLIRPYDSKRFELMRRSLRRAMALNPVFAESFYLFAFINLVQDVDYDGGIAALERALELAPDNLWYRMRLGEFFYRQGEIDRAEEIARLVAEKTNDQRLADYARRNLAAISELRERKNKETGGQPENYLRDSEGTLTEAELKQLEEKLVVEALNQMLRKPKEGEERIIGTLSKIDCRRRGIYYHIKTETGQISFRSRNFENLRFAIYNNSLDGERIKCGSSFPGNLVIITYHPAADPAAAVTGEVIGLEFVPPYFHFPKSHGSFDK